MTFNQNRGVQRSMSDFNCDKHKSQNITLFNSDIHYKLVSNSRPTFKQEKYFTSMTRSQDLFQKVQGDSASKYQSLQDISFTVGSIYSEEDNMRRSLIYDNVAFRDNDDDFNLSTVQENNEIFEMVFLNKPKFKDSLSTQGSYTKQKTYKKDPNELGIKDFKIGKKLGAGKFGEVFVARHIKTGLVFALKRMDKLKIDNKLLIQLIREIKIQSYLNHPNIVKLYSFFSDQRYVYLLMELCCSGELFSFLKKKRKLTENFTKAILKDILKALDYMHQRQIIHRDLKPQNIIYHNGMVKLCDFGWSVGSKAMRQTFCGTPLYVSPELLKQKNYNNKIDVWSLGIMTYELLFGKVPFDINSQVDFIKIVEDQIKFSKATHITNEAKQFILICLNKDPKERYTAHQLLDHPFIAKSQPIQLAEMF